MSLYISIFKKPAILVLIAIIALIAASNARADDLK